MQIPDWTPVPVQRAMSKVLMRAVSVFCALEIRRMTKQWLPEGFRVTRCSIDLRNEAAYVVDVRITSTTPQSDKAKRDALMAPYDGISFYFGVSHIPIRVQVYASQEKKCSV